MSSVPWQPCASQEQKRGRKRQLVTGWEKHHYRLKLFHGSSTLFPASEKLNSLARLLPAPFA